MEESFQVWCLPPYELLDMMGCLFCYDYSVPTDAAGDRLKAAHTCVTQVFLYYHSYYSTQENRPQLDGRLNICIMVSSDPDLSGTLSKMTWGCSADENDILH